MLPREIEAKYEIRGTLGSGAMGTVYDALDRLIERRVAVKIVKRPPPGDPEGEEAHARFRREAQAAGRLSHPNIVGVYDYGENGETAWIVMELVEGGSLKQRLDRQERFTIPEIVRLMDQVLAALAYSHGRGVVHRDIKPGNVMLGSDGTVKLADFGIARLENSSMTQVGTVIGTPSYMAPEQLRGETVDARADIWAAGVMLYQLLTGEKPFEGGFSAVMHKALHTEPPPPSQLSVTAPRAFDAVISKALAKRPEDRFPNAQAFAEAIRAAAAAPATEAGYGGGGSLPGLDSDATMVSGSVAPARPAPPPAPPPARPEPPARKLPIGLILGAGGGLAAAAVAGWLVLGQGGGGGQTDAGRQRQDAGQTDAGRQRQDAGQTDAGRQRQDAGQQQADAAAEAARRQQQEAQAQAAAEAARRQQQEAQAQAAADAARRQQQDAQSQAAADAARRQQQDAQSQAAADAARRQQEAQAQAAAEAEKRRQQDAQAQAAAEAEKRRQQDAQAQAAAEAEKRRQQDAQAQAAATEKQRQQDAQAAAEAEKRRQQEALDADKRRQQEALDAQQRLRANLRSAAAAAVAEPCSLLAATTGDDRATVSGLVRRGGEAAIRQDFASRGIPADALTLQLTPFDGPYCDLIEAIRPIAAMAPEAAPRGRVLGSMPLAKGELLRLSVEMPDYPAQLYLAYVMSTGEVANLVPSRPEAARARVTLGDPAPNFPGWEVDEPFGTDLVLVFSSDRPIFAQRRPVVEKQADYLAALTGRLRALQQQGARVSVRVLPVETVAKH